MDDKQRTPLSPKKQPVHPKQKASFLSNLFFCWTLPLFVKGFKKDLSEEDLYGTLKDHESQKLGDRLEEAWFKQLNTRRNPSLWKALITVFWKEFATYGLPSVITECGLKMSQPLLIGKLMEYYTPNEEIFSKNTAYLYAGGIVITSFLVVLVVHTNIIGLQHLGMKMRVANSSLIYRKSLRLSKSALAETTVGQVVNLLSNDVSRFDMVTAHMHNLWVCPLQVSIIVYLLHVNLGFGSLVGILVLLLFIPVQMYLAKKVSVYRLRTALKTDQRLRLMNEIVTGIQVIKMYTWEKPFAKLVDVARKLEIQQVRANSYIRALNMSFAIFLNRLAVFFCVLAYVLTGNVLQSQYVYVVTSFYGMLRNSLTVFVPNGITFLGEANVSVKRIEKFLTLYEIQPNLNGCHNIREEKDLSLFEISESSLKKPTGIHMNEASVRWLPTSEDCTLSNVTMNVNPNELVAVIGTVGSGKTTLLHVILKELPLIEGSVDVGGTVSYASQESWIFGGSIRQNILFGQQTDAKRYKEVVRVCALERDFSLFPHGDLTIVGERGVMLSGGQKARINLARAVYKNADIYLLDDPLSAVDTHVGKQLFDDCIVNFLKNKCVILVTHQLQYLKSVNRIYLLHNGSINISGTYSELKEFDNEFFKLLEGEEEEADEKRLSLVRKNKSFESSELTEVSTGVKEEKRSGNISKRVYKSYFKAGGNMFVAFILGFLFILVQVNVSGTDYFLNFWVNLEQMRLERNITVDENQNHTNIREEFEEIFFTSDNCLYIYSAQIFFLICMASTQSISFFEFCMRASRNLHNNMFSRIVNTSMRFFNLNSSGRILNRFSKDMGVIDEILPLAILDTFQIGLMVIAINIVIALVNPWILIPSVVMFGLFYTIRVVFLATSRDVKRIEGTTRSPVFTHITASLQGLTTIRALGAQEILKVEFDKHQDLHSSAFYLFLGCTRTFGIWLDMHCVVYITLVTLSFLFIENEKYGGDVGLAITQSIILTGTLQWGMRQWGELENQMTSVERVVEYAEVDPEPDDETKKPPKFWPTVGNIYFQSVSLRYAYEEPFVLRDLSFKISSTDKVGVVGRTGAGKSSLISALFRLVDIEGSIIIDGVNTKNISLQSLRSKISIIPQEPFLYSGPLRKNLDPFDEYNDDNLWNALEEVELKNTISDLPSGLFSIVSEGGSNFSVGQRQLLCLTRAVLRNNKILILDEATANVDPQTDELIQKTIRRKFRDCTVLTIAHRLHTVMDSDKILVMEAGKVVEFDRPHVLLQNTSGVFYGLVHQTGKGMAENLMKFSAELHRSGPKAFST